MLQIIELVKISVLNLHDSELFKFRHLILQIFDLVKILCLQVVLQNIELVRNSILSGVEY